MTAMDSRQLHQGAVSKRTPTVTVIRPMTSMMMRRALSPTTSLADQDPDDDGIANQNDLDSDNDGLRDTEEVSGGVTIDPSLDEDGDNVPNGLDEDIDGDGILNINDPDADDDGNADSFTLTDINGDGVADEFDADLDGVPNYLDLRLRQ